MKSEIEWVPRLSGYRAATARERIYTRCVVPYLPALTCRITDVVIGR